MRGLLQADDLEKCLRGYMSYADIGRKYGISRQAVHDAAKRWNLLDIRKHFWDEKIEEIKRNG